VSSHPNVHTLGDVVLDESDGSRIITNAVGIDDAPEIRSAIEAKAQQSGAWDGVGLYGARVIQLEGYAESDSPDAAQAFADSLRALSPAELYELVVESQGRGVRSATVRVQAGAVLQWLDEDAFTYVLTVVAPDPLLYGARTLGSAGLSGSVAGSGRAWPRVWLRDWGVAAGVTPGALAMPNAGTVTYWPTLRIDGPVTNPTVTCPETGDWVSFGATIPTGQFVELDCRNRLARFGANGDDVRYLIDSGGAWLGIPPGGASLSFTADTADAAALLTAIGYEGAWT